jgi:hypothetical protein
MMVNVQPEFGAVLKHLRAKGKPEKHAETGMAFV